MSRRALVLTLTGVALLLMIAAVAAAAYWQSAAHEMRRFNEENASRQLEWKVFGGAWQAGGAQIRNNSDDRGAKLLAGSTAWKDYTLSAELHFDGDHGDMGVIVRARNAEEGADSYDGYYVGLRAVDGMLVVGRSDYGWIETRPIPMPGGVHSSAWYRIRVTVVGCHLAASSENLASGQMAFAALKDDVCLERGQVGVRSFATGGNWRNVRVHAARLHDYELLAAKAGGARPLELPRREADYNRNYRFSTADASTVAEVDEAAPVAAQINKIADLARLPRHSRQTVNLHGIVTLVSPALYVQDADGAVQVRVAHSPQLNVGDAVEVRGVAEPGSYSSVIQNGTVRLLWSGTSVPPIAVTPGQAASGAYDAKFVETEARLVGEQEGAHGDVLLEFAENSQSYRALLPAAMARALPKLERNSMVRVRGVCVLDREVTSDATPFILLPRSADDVQMVAAAPWWTPWHVTIVSVCVIGLIMLAQMGYYRVHQWQARSVTRERERLAHEIHDTMAQSFAGVGYQIQGIRSRVIKGERIEQAQIADQLSVAYQLVRRCHEEASRTISMLGNASPEVQTNLLGMLQETARRIAGQPIDVQMTVEGDVYPLHLRCANALLMIGQEAISNALGHGEATALELSLKLNGRKIEFEVRDNGRGFDAAIRPAGFGIQGMQKRARDIAGRFEMSSEIGTGTRLAVCAPMLRETGFEWMGMRWALLGLRLREWLREALNEPRKN